MDDFLKFMEKLVHGNKAKFVILKKEIKFTENLFGSVEDLKIYPLQLVEKNERGDCMCLCNDEYLVDVDARDIQTII